MEWWNAGVMEYFLKQLLFRGVAMPLCIAVHSIKGMYSTLI
jgi:hypothetical protein